MAYSEEDGIPKWEWAEEITYDAPNTGHFTWIPRPTWEILEHNAVGALRVTRRWKKDDFALWSDIHPLGYMLYDWYQNDQELWATMRCEEWYEREVNEDEYVLELEPCPCNLSQALADRGRFKPTLECNLESDEFYCYQRSTIVHCVENIVPSPRGSDSVCCYDEFENLVYSGDSEEASFSRKYTKEGIVPYNAKYSVPLLSHWIYDGLPYFFCCVWGNRCEYYQRLRETPDCKEYEVPRSAAIFGDPHIMTFDGVGYTFNGKGEYTLMKTTSDVATSFTIQARTEQATNTRGEQVQATVVTAVAMKEEDSDTIHIQRSERTILEVLINGEVLDLKRQTSLHFYGVYLNFPYTYENGNITRVTVTFEDSLIGVVVNGTSDMLVCHVFIPDNYKNRVEGLMGTWNDDPTDDLTDNGGSVISPDDTPQRIYEFAKSWEIQDTAEKLFYYEAGTNHEYYQDNGFIPAFTPPNTLPSEVKEGMEQVCDGNVYCEYDVRMTENVWLGKATKEGYDHYMQNQNASVDLVVCEYIPTPINGTKTFFRERNYLVGSEIEFECDDDFVLVGTQYRVCEGSGEWTGDDLQNDCIPSPICGGLDPVEHGSIDIKGEDDVLEAEINCDEGFELYGSSKRVCDIENEEWTGKAYTGCYGKIACFFLVCRLRDDDDKERDDHYNDYGMQVFNTT
ncbi:sushi domain-containing protein 2-like [Anneissia japonica]|uniref:sushi domain-containing protein 2-like n=1 Tax=Anneissia japonica TaxID=1529436 RepID=UPI00142575E1|nr:sushi domain-containing protein 2-like [Anneissia japonica]